MIMLPQASGTFRIVIPGRIHVRFAPGSGHYASIDLNYRFVPEADVRNI